MSYREPISIQTTYTNADGVLVEKQFRSLNQASKFFSITIQSLKELSMGMTPKLHEKTPQDLKVIRVPISPKLTNDKPKDGNWHCDICNKDIKSKSRYAHVTTNGHLKLKNALEQTHIMPGQVEKSS